jgi:RimJ/RimL family protein N-acetyltransferase
MHLVLDKSADVAAWVAARIPQMQGAGDFGACAAIGVEGEDGRPLGGVVFHNYQPRFRNIEVSFASDTPRWLTRNLIRRILSYPFEQLNCARLTAITPRKAASARRFLDVFGFKREGLVRRGFGTDDAVISGLLKREWARSRWAAASSAPRRNC